MCGTYSHRKGRRRTRDPLSGASVRRHDGSTHGARAVTGALAALLRASHLLTPDDLAARVAVEARTLGVRETVLYLADYEQITLLPVSGDGVPERRELPIEGTMAGRAFRRVEVVASRATRGTHRLWIPLLDGVERLGVAELELPSPPDGNQQEDLKDFVTLVAELVVTQDAYSDVFARLRRRRTLSLAAEMQWGLLPPLSFGTDRLVITGGLEPAYDIGGDSFDYAVNGGIADLLVLDAVGHGLPAAVLASVAISAYRHARRNGLDLPDIAAEIDEAVAGQFGASQFATAVLARLDVDTGRLRWVNAGHPEPLILRGSSLVQPPHCPPNRPLGLQGVKAACCETRLEPGDRLLLYTDGITEARSPTGEFFGEERLADFVAAAVAAGEPAPETVRQLMRHVLDHQAEQLQDDASIVVLEWRTGDQSHLLL
jgi:serine phosphatase RsbU (regulator of sigma subunit)